MKTNPPRSPLKKASIYTAYGAIVALAFWGGRLSNPPAAPAAQSKNIKIYANASFTDGQGRPALPSVQPGPNVSLTDLLNSKGRPDAELLANWAKSLTPDEIAAALKSLQGLPAGLQRDAILAAVVNAWASNDPQGFLASSGNVTVPRLREGGVDSALRAWAATDPKAALDWMSQNPGAAPPAALRQRYVAAIAGYASTDPQGALTTVAGLSANTPADMILRNNALRTVTNAMADSGNFTGAVALFNQLPAGQMQTMAYNSLVQRWAQDSPEDASQWVANLSDPTVRNQLGMRVAQTWAASDPAAAATWAAQLDQQSSAGGPTDGPSSQLLASAIRSWAAYDLDAPAQFLNQLPASPDRDNAVALFATRAAQEDPSGAMQWVNTIADDQMRSRAATMVALEMMQQDPDSANEFLANTTLLTDQQKQALQNMPQRFSTRLGFAMAGGFGGGGGGGGAGGGGGGGGFFQNRIDNMILNGGGLFNRINGQGGQNGNGNGGGQNRGQGQGGRGG